MEKIPRTALTCLLPEFQKNCFTIKGNPELKIILLIFICTGMENQFKPPKNIRFDFFPAGCLCFKYDDTLLLNSGLGSSVGVGVGIKIYGGKFTGSLHANNQNKLVYKQSLDDSVYQNNILAEPVSQSLKLYRNPSYAAGEVIIGEYWATYKNSIKKMRIIKMKSADTRSGSFSNAV